MTNIQNPNKPIVSVIISNTNTREVMRLCLQNLKKIKDGEYPNLEVVVADSHSHDGSADMVKKEFPWVILVETMNDGLADNLNKAVEKASGKYYLYLGTDGFPKEGVITGLVEYFEKHSDVGGASVKLELRTGEMDMDCHRGFSTPWVSITHFLGLDKKFPKSELFAKYFMTYEDLDAEHEIDMCITHFFFVRKEAHDKVGMWDTDYIVYGEDIDMCYRIKEGGYKIMYLPQFQAEHWKGVTVGRKETSDIEPEDVTYHLAGKDYSIGGFRIFMRRLSTRGMELFYKKHLRKKYPFFFNWMVLSWIKLLETKRVKAQIKLNKENGWK